MLPEIFTQRQPSQYCPDLLAVTAFQAGHQPCVLFPSIDSGLCKTLLQRPSDSPPLQQPPLPLRWTYILSAPPHPPSAGSLPCPTHALLSECLPKQVAHSSHPHVYCTWHVSPTFSEPSQASRWLSSFIRPPDSPALSQPPALLRPALLAVAKLHSRTLRPHPGLRHRLLSAERRPSRFAPRGSRSPARNREGTQGGYRLTVMHYTRMTAAAVNAASAAVSIPATPHFLLPKTTTPRKHREGPAAPGMHRSSQSEATLDCGPCRRACGCVHQADTPTDASLRSL